MSSLRTASQCCCGGWPLAQILLLFLHPKLRQRVSNIVELKIKITTVTSATLPDGLQGSVLRNTLPGSFKMFQRCWKSHVSDIHAERRGDKWRRKEIFLVFACQSMMWLLFHDGFQIMNKKIKKNQQSTQQFDWMTWIVTRSLVKVKSDTIR